MYRFHGVVVIHVDTKLKFFRVFIIQKPPENRSYIGGGQKLRTGSLVLPVADNILTLITGPKNNHVKQVLGSFLTPT